ncbi:MAG: hypothetical protein V4525_10895 [Pseudomonadota bacterium]
MMTPEQWWKNFALGIELDASGTFIYNGIKSLDELSSFQYPVDTFEVLYNLSVGIERLLKVAIILIEHENDSDIEELEKSLITHNTIDLTNRVDRNRNLNLASLHKEFLALLSKFYKSHRYGRYSLSSVPNINEEKIDFLKYIQRHLKIELSITDEFAFIGNTDQIKKFIGKVVKKISSALFTIINKEAHRLNIYTTELRGGSKALRVFYGERLDFIDERIKKKEIILYLINQNTVGNHIDLIRSFEPLALDEENIPQYIQALLNDSALSFVGDEIDELYTDVKDVSKRLQFIDIIDNDYLSYEGGDEA